MMKKLLLFLAIMSICTARAQFPSVGILGTATSLGWSGTQPDIAMSTSDGTYYFLENMPLYTGGLKFRQDNSWPLNWGNTDWPGGVGVQDQGGMDIPVQVGVYDVSFNLETKEYSFVYKFPVIGVRGGATSVDWDSANGDLLFNTADGVTYTYHNLSITTGGLKFRQDNDWPNNWGGAGWPSGTGIFNQDGVDIQAIEGSYNVTFNRTTLEYSFVQVFPSVGILGSATPAGWDGQDIDLQTTDGVVYTLENMSLTDGGVKFRLDDQWPNNWGGADWPSGTGIFNQNGVDIPCQAGIYNITFNLSTLAYSFQEVVAETENFKAIAVSLYPNPASDSLTLSFDPTASVSIVFYDMNGRNILSFEAIGPDAAMDVSSLAPGIYLAKVMTPGASCNLHFIKK